MTTLVRSGRRVAAFVATCAGALALAACGSAGAATPTPAATSTPASTSSAAKTVAVPKATSASGPYGTHNLTIVSQGRKRTFLLSAPTGSGPHPLVLVFHGAEDTAAHTVAETDVGTVGKSRGWIVAFPQGYQDTWNEGAGDTPAHAAGLDDVVFTQQILRYIEAHYSVDRTRIAAVGLSNGALLAELLGCRIASQVTLIVPIEGQLPVSVSPGCTPTRPINVFEIHGTADTTIPYGGGHFDGVGGGTTVLSAPASATRWATLDRCRTGSPSSSTFGSSTLTTFSGCAERASVTLDTIQGGTHEWPQGLGELIAAQFSAHPARTSAATP